MTSLKAPVKIQKKFSPGLWLIDKPIGWTSFDVVAKIRALSGIKKVGHAGTLDPAAEGLLLVAVGREHTRQLEELVMADKEYIAEVTLGIKTDSGDREGVVIKESRMEVTELKARKALAELQGKQAQIPPMHSAIRKKGKKLYELARQGLEIEREPRQIEINEIELLGFIQGEFPILKVRVLCSKGTYIRVLAEKIGEKLGGGAFLSGLKRTKIGKYNIDDAVKITEEQ
ncbi:tRNA pseudouridine(55) synthase TruB [Candidatus Margulisiibacteriota bacterium]